jgi:hypothetical protein
VKIMVSPTPSPWPVSATEISPQYVAGFFDGEGTVSLIFTKRRPWKRDPEKHVLGFRFVVGIANTDRPILKCLQTQFGGDLNLSKRENPNRRHKPVYAWKIVGADRQRTFLQTIAPFCVVKARHIAAGLEYLMTVTTPGQRLDPDAWEVRLRVYAELRQLNQRGAEKEPRHTLPGSPSLGWNPKHRSYSETEIAEMMKIVRAGRKSRINDPRI